LVTGYTYLKGTVTGAAFAVVETEVATSGLQIQKDATPTSGLEAGDIVDYTLTVTNNGNTTAYYVVVQDSMLALDPDPTPFDLDNGESKTFTGSYTVQEYDLWSGQIDNTATVTGFTEDLNGDGTPDLSDSDSVTVYTIEANPNISIVKTVEGDPAYVYSPGETINYSMLITNTGNVTLYIPMLTDDDITFNTGEVIPSPFLPGESFTLTGFYVAQEDDGPVFTNTAYVTASYRSVARGEEGDNTVTDSDSADANVLVPNESVSITKTADVSNVIAGGTITYSIYVTNNGNVSIWGTFADPMLGVQQYFELAPGDSTTPVVESYTTTSADVPQVVNTASVYLRVEGFGDDTQLPPPDDTDTVTVTVGILPPPPPPPVLAAGISVTISPDATLVESGTPVTFTMVVTNTGQLVLSDVNVENADLAFSTVIPKLYVAGSETFQVTKTLTEVGDFTYTVTATGTAPSVSAVSDTDVTSVGVFEENIPENPPEEPVVPPEEPVPGDTVENPQTGAVPFNAFTVSGLMTFGAGIFALIKRKKESDGE
jgi:LPXTG-motif cell wall-anchored protein